MVGVSMSFVASLALVLVIRLRVLSVGMQCFLSFSPSGLFFILIVIVLSVAQIKEKWPESLYPPMTIAAIVVPPIAAIENPHRSQTQKNNGSFLTNYFICVSLQPTLHNIVCKQFLLRAMPLRSIALI